jgi:hypothetical protein
MPPELWASSSNGSQIGNSTRCAVRFDSMRADGLRVDDNYPLTCQLVADISNPLKLTIEDLRVDNSSFYE